MDQLTREVRYNKWADIIVAANNSGMTKEEFCKQNGINRKTFYYYQRKLRQELGTYITETKETQFVEVPVAAGRTQSCPAAVIHVGSVSIDIADGISESTLISIGRIIRNAL